MKCWLWWDVRRVQSSLSQDTHSDVPDKDAKRYCSTLLTSSFYFERLREREREREREFCRSSACSNRSSSLTMVELYVLKGRHP
ncbi:hypothetical protein MUK42_36107 [Musa troglodytarum]|uniref:Uncharacterized protein n=1 Tax=Musa troglodytarum TaxID=320322 RepID=A0A9E7H0D7_9LILI|nr:hypothetical protein MUK42_36107 [Musa troglodytarum]